MSKDSSSKPRLIAKAASYRYALTVSALFGSVLLFVASQVIGILFFTIVLSLAGFSVDQITDLLDSNTLARLLAILCIEAISIGSVVAFLRFADKKPFTFLKLDKKPSWKDVRTTLAAYGLYFVSFVVIAILGDLLISGLDVDQQQQLGYGSLAGLDYLWVFLTLVILPPLAEEILFRGFLYQILCTTTAKRVAVVLTSIVFALAHLEFFSGASLNWIAAIDTFVLSLFLIWLLEKTQSLWPSILLHALKNSIAFVVLFVV